MSDEEKARPAEEKSSSPEHPRPRARSTADDEDFGDESVLRDDSW
jgi:hypothetical protein